MTIDGDPTWFSAPVRCCGDSGCDRYPSKVVDFCCAYALACAAVTFCLEVFLRVSLALLSKIALSLNTVDGAKGREAEVAGLLCVQSFHLSPSAVVIHRDSPRSVILRLWRLIKLVSTVSVDVTEYNDVEQRPKTHTPSTLPRDAADWWQKEKRELIEELERVKAELEQAKVALFGKGVNV